jgi:hypothetical protein
MGLIATTFTGNVPDYDILSMDKDLRVVPIQVKASRYMSWQFSLDKFLEIELKGEIQRVKRKKRLSHPDLICVFVRLVEQSKDEFFILHMRDVQNIICRNHKSFLKRCGGRRPRKPSSMHTAIKVEHLQQFKDNWKLVKDGLKQSRR